MPGVGERERRTQRRIVTLFRDRLRYDYLGDWTDRPGNRNIEEDYLRRFLRETQGYDDALITRALYALTKAAGDTSKSIYDRNREIYELLRYGVNGALVLLPSFSGVAVGTTSPATIEKLNAVVLCVMPFKKKIEKIPMSALKSLVKDSLRDGLMTWPAVQEKQAWLGVQLSLAASPNSPTALNPPPPNPASSSTLKCARFERE